MTCSMKRVLGPALASLGLLACEPGDRAPEPAVKAVEEPPAAAALTEDPHQSLVLDRILAGEDEAEGLVFGVVRHVAVEASGNVVVEDAMGRAVVRLGPNGEFRDSLGRVGPGPGEYQYPFGVAALPDGSVAVRDNQPPAILIFDSLGDFVREWSLYDRVNLSEGLDIELSADPDGQLRLLVPSERPSDMYALPEFGFVTLTPTGEIVDIVAPPASPWDAPQVYGDYHARKHVAWHPEGFPVVGMSDAYHLEIQRPDGPVRIERSYKRRVAPS